MFRNPRNSFLQCDMRESLSFGVYLCLQEAVAMKQCRVLAEVTRDVAADLRLSARYVLRRIQQ